MVSPRHVLCGLLCLASAHGVAAERARVPPLCPENAPEGVRLPAQPGCGASVPYRRSDERDGFQEIGGIKLRVGGRLGAEYGAGR